MCYHTKNGKAMKRTNFFVFVLSILFIMLWGCSEDNPTEPQQSTAVTSKLSDIQAKVFTLSCALSGCHGSTNNQAGLLLTAGNSFSNLVNVQSMLFSQFKRVEPSNSANSLLIKILKGEVSPRMPFNRDPLSPAVIDSISKWIDNGAFDN
jgi:hypothetical protein